MYSARYSCQILMKLDFCDRFSKNPQISNFTKTRLAEELFHADRRTNLRTDMTKLISPFFKFCERA